MAPRPLLFGYQRVRLMTPVADVVKARRALIEFASREGFALGEIFVDADENRPYAALNALIATARRREVNVILIPSLDHLGHDPSAQGAMRRRLAEEVGLRVVVLAW